MAAFIPTCATPKRWEMASFLFSGICIVYTLRVCMSVAAVKMKEELEWSETDKGNILSSFYWGYTLGQVPASRIAQKYGAKWLFGLSVAIPSFLTLLVPVAAHHSVGMTLFIRVLIGFFESATFPALFYFFPVWVPLAEKTFMIPFIVSGMYVGDIIGFSVSGALANSNFYINDKFYGGWQSIFYVFGLIGLAWFPLWCYAAHESPHVHPYITKEEIHLIHAGKEIPLEDMEDDEKDEEERQLSKTVEDTNATTSATISANSDATATTSATTSAISDATSTTSSNAATALLLSPTMPTTALKPSELTTILELDQTTDDIELGITTSTTNTIPAIPKATQLTRQNSANNETSSSKKDIAHTCHFQAYSKTMFAEKMHHYSRAELAQRTPWKHFVTHPTAQALLGCSFVFGWIGFTLLSEMPSFFTDALDFDLETAGILCVFPYAALFLATLAFGRLFDRLQHAHDWSVDAVRKTAMFLSFVCCATALVIAGYLNEQYAAYVLIIITQIFYAAAQVGLGCAWTDIAPLYSSSLNSLGNMLAALAGILGPIIVSAFLTTWPGRAGWQAAFWLTFALSGAAMIVWMLFIKAEIVPVLNTPIKLASD